MILKYLVFVIVLIQNLVKCSFNPGDRMEKSLNA